MCRKPSRPRARLVGLAAASAGIIAGYDLSNIASALPSITDGFHLSTPQQELVATAAVIGQVIGAIGGGPIANAAGRKKSLVMVTAAYAALAALGALSPSMPMLLAARLMLGVTVGISIVVTPVFVAESTPAAIRGSLLVSYQVVTVTGIVLGYLAGYLLAGCGWRWMLALAAWPALLATLLVRRLPETARWYMLKARTADARRALQLVEPDQDVEAELAEIDRALREESGGVPAEMLRRPFLRATAFVVGLGFFTQITGINAIIAYSPRLFERLGFRGHSALLLLPALVQLAALAAVILALLLVDRVGRRPILLVGITAIIVADLLLAGVFAAGSDSRTALTRFGFVGVLTFVVGFNFGFGSLVSVYAGESMPARLRSPGAGVMLTASLVTNAIVIGVFLTVLDSLGGARTFAVFGALTVAGFAFVHRYAPETKGRQLEEIRHFWENGGRWPDGATATVNARSCL